VTQVDEFFEAIERGDRTEVERHLAATPELTSARREGATALHLAAIDNHAEVVDLLVERGAEIDATDDELGMTPAGWANEKGHTDMVQRLAERGARFDLHSAAAFGMTLRLRTLLAEDPSDLNRSNAFGTPLHFAAVWGQPEAAEILLIEGADRSLRNCHGQTALEIARAQASSDAAACEIVLPHRRAEIVAGCRAVAELLQTG
jgi:ankyrin repeat protein